MIVRAGCLSLLFALAPLLPVAAQEPPERTALDGVYTQEQAERGLSAFRSFCGNCHTSGEFQGDFFQRRVGGDPVVWLYDFIRYNMPDDSPGSLTRQAYVNIMAYILELNGYPAGEEELGSSVNPMEEIHFPDVEEDPAGRR